MLNRQGVTLSGTEIRSLLCPSAGARCFSFRMRTTDGDSSPISQPGMRYLMAISSKIMRYLIPISSETMRYHIPGMRSDEIAKRKSFV